MLNIVFLLIWMLLIAQEDIGTRLMRSCTWLLWPSLGQMQFMIDIRASPPFPPSCRISHDDDNHDYYTFDSLSLF